MKTVDGDARRVAVSLLARGLARPHEVAALAGVSRQVVEYWCRGVDWERVRLAHLATIWRKGMRHGPRLVETAKARQQQ